jgi:hypothetical protein
MDTDVEVEPVNHYGLNLNNRNCKLIATAPQIDGLFVLDRVLDLELNEYPDIDDRCLLALETSGHASWNDEQKRILWYRCLAHIGLKALEIFTTISHAPKMTGMSNCEGCIMCKLAPKPIAPTTSCATEPLQLVHSDLCSHLETASRGGRYMLLFIADAMRHTDPYILKYKSEVLENFKEWKALREKESGNQVK